MSYLCYNFDKCLQFDFSCDLVCAVYSRVGGAPKFQFLHFNSIFELFTTNLEQRMHLEGNCMLGSTFFILKLGFLDGLT